MDRKLTSYMDNIEVRLISKFFNVDCLSILSPRIGLIEKLSAENTRSLRSIGRSNYFNVVDFYRFEYKPNEEVFWSSFIADKVLEDIEIDLIVTKLPFDYLWLDYVTDVYFSFILNEDELCFESFSRSDNLYQRSLELVVKMVFLSDFKRENLAISIEKEWHILFQELEDLNLTLKRLKRG